MGIGEPFDNFGNVMNAVDIINNPKGLEIGARHISISTCGIVPKIEICNVLFQFLFIMQLMKKEVP